MPKVFVDETLKKGEILFNNHRVSKIERKENSLEAIVKDDMTYHVRYTISAKNKVTDMECSCQSDKNCAHEAALFYALKKYDLLNPKASIPILSISELFNQLKQSHPTPATLHSLFASRLNNNILKNYLTSTDYNEYAIKNLTLLIEEFVSIEDYPKRYIRRIHNDFKNTLVLLFQQHGQYGLDFLPWLVSKMDDPFYEDYQSLFNVILANNLTLDFINVLGDVLVSKGLAISEDSINYLLDLYFNTLDKNQINMSSYLELTKKYSDNVYYKYYQLHYMLNHQQEKQAKEMYEIYIDTYQLKDNKLMEDIKKEIDLKSGDIDAIIKNTLDYLSLKRNQNDLSSITTLKGICKEKWDQYLFDFYDKLAKKMTETKFISVLKKEEEYQYMVKYVYDEGDFDILKRFEREIKRYNKEIYSFLYVYCFFKEIDQWYSRYDYFNIGYYLDDLKEIGIDDKGIEKIIFYIRQLYPRKTALLEYIDKYEQDEGYSYYLGDDDYY